MKKLADGFQLSNDVSLPCIGYGTWQTPDGEIASESVKLAIEAGYRHIDCAAVYANEASVGHGIKSSGIPRNELFVTSKVWNTERGYDKIIKAFEPGRLSVRGKCFPILFCRKSQTVTESLRHRCVSDGACSMRSVHYQSL